MVEPWGLCSLNLCQKRHTQHTNIVCFRNPHPPKKTNSFSNCEGGRWWCDISWSTDWDSNPSCMAGEIADEELDLPPEPVLPTPVTGNGKCHIRCMCVCMCVVIRSCSMDHLLWTLCIKKEDCEPQAHALRNGIKRLQ